MPSIDTATEPLLAAARRLGSACSACVGDPMKFAQARAEAAKRERIVKADRLGPARWHWAKRKPIGGSILRSARGYGGRLPETLGFPPGRRDHPPTMIAAFSMVIEPDEPGKLAPAGQIEYLIAALRRARGRIRRRSS
jgi:hypothetical protein